MFQTYFKHISNIFQSQITKKTIIKNFFYINSIFFNGIFHIKSTFSTVWPWRRFFSWTKFSRQISQPSQLFSTVKKNKKTKNLPRTWKEIFLGKKNFSDKFFPPKSTFLHGKKNEQTNFYRENKWTWRGLSLGKKYFSDTFSLQVHFFPR